MSEQEVKELDLNGEMLVRREKLAALRKKGNAFPNQFRRDALAQDLHDKYEAEDGEVLKEKAIEVAVAGRIMTRRAMGKATFITLQDMSGKIQLYVARDNLPEGVYAEDVGNWDLGDIIGVKGTLFKTKTNELTIKTTEVQLLTKALRPLPNKFHGLTDMEARYRQRYLDLISNSKIAFEDLFCTLLICDANILLKNCVIISSFSRLSPIDLTSFNPDNNSS